MKSEDPSDGGISKAQDLKRARQSGLDSIVGFRGTDTCFVSSVPTPRLHMNDIAKAGKDPGTNSNVVGDRTL